MDIASIVGKIACVISAVQQITTKQVATQELLTGATTKTYTGVKSISYTAITGPMTVAINGVAQTFPIVGTNTTVNGGTVSSQPAIIDSTFVITVPAGSIAYVTTLK